MKKQSEISESTVDVDKKQGGHPKNFKWRGLPSFGQVAVIFSPTHSGNWVAAGFTPKLHTLVH